MFARKIVFRNLSSLIKMDALLDAVPLVKIDEGIFKYVLIKVYGKEDPNNGKEAQKSIVR